jgi:hypothetical protein
MADLVDFKPATILKTEVIMTGKTKKEPKPVDVNPDPFNDDRETEALNRPNKSGGKK